MDSTGILVLGYLQVPLSSQLASPLSRGQVSFGSCHFPYKQSACPPGLLLYAHWWLLCQVVGPSSPATLQTLVKLLTSCEDGCSYFGSTEGLLHPKAYLPPTHYIILFGPKNKLPLLTNPACETWSALPTAKWGACQSCIRKMQLSAALQACSIRTFI